MPPSCYGERTMLRNFEISNGRLCEPVIVVLFFLHLIFTAASSRGRNFRKVGKRQLCELHKGVGRGGGKAQCPALHTAEGQP